jgi:glycosyltransferase involved in cell wall biosynthesis
MERVVFFHRKPRPKSYFSIENLFGYIRAALPETVSWEVKEMSYFSEGFFKRLFISLEAAVSQKGINHITGDIHFIAIFLRRRKTILTIHDVGFMEQQGSIGRFLMKWFWIILPVKRSSVITTVSVSTKLELLKYVRVAPSRIRVVYDPIDPMFRPFPKAFNKSEPTILQIGTKFNKNLVRLIQALEGINCRLEIVGTPDVQTRQALDKAKVKHTVFIGLTNQEVLERYNQADIISFVSTYEGFGLPIVEANAVGRAVITSNLLSMPEVAGDAAHLVDPYNVDEIRQGIKKIIEDDDYRNELVKNGFANRKRFDAMTIAGQYLRIYSSLQD